MKLNSTRLTPAAATQLAEHHGILFFPRLRNDADVHGTLSLCERFTQHLPAQFMPLGAYSYARSYFTNVTRIGRYCSIGEHVQVMGNRHPLDWVSSNPVFYRRKRARAWGSNRTAFPTFDDVGPPVTIADDVWVGDDVLLAHGITLGTGCVVAARSVVTHDVPPYAIVAGTPARVIRHRFDDPTIERLLQSRWWDWPIAMWDKTDPRSITAFLEQADAVQGQPRMAEDRKTPAEWLGEQPSLQV